MAAFSARRPTHTLIIADLSIDFNFDDSLFNNDDSDMIRFLVMIILILAFQFITPPHVYLKRFSASSVGACLLATCAQGFLGIRRSN